jgi:hypothetical protein
MDSAYGPLAAVLRRRLRQLEAYVTFDDAFAGPGRLRPHSSGHRFALDLDREAVLVVQRMNEADHELLVIGVDATSA